MRLLAGASAAVVLLMTLPPASAVGGVLVTGVGFGDTYLPNGEPFCSGHPLSARAIYLPTRDGMLDLDYWPNQSCPQSNGGGTFAANLEVQPGSVPQARITFACVGTAGTGMFCTGTGVTGESAWARVGSYAGPGSIVSLTFSDPDRTLTGFFTAL